MSCASFVFHFAERFWLGYMKERRQSCIIVLVEGFSGIVQERS